MMAEHIVPQSAGSLSVAVMALIMVIVQGAFFFRKSRWAWYGWGAAISFSGMLYAVGVFLEYNAPAGPVNRFAGLLEFTAVIFLVHCLYGFTFASLRIDGRLYHALAGTFHGLLLVVLWSGKAIVADRFVTHRFLGLARPYVEADLGPLGAPFMIYAILASCVAALIWFLHRRTDARYRVPYLAGIMFWIVLGIHDGLAFQGMPTLQYGMEYGFLGYSIILLWIGFDNYVDISGEDKYRIITELANDGILVIQDGRVVFANAACRAFLGRPLVDSAVSDFLDDVATEDKAGLIDYYRALLRDSAAPDALLLRFRKEVPPERVVEVRASRIGYRGRPAALMVARDITERVCEAEARRENEVKLARLRKMESLGVLAGGVAHDLNNVLSGIVGYPQLILTQLPLDSTVRRSIELVQQSGQRAAAIVQDLLTVARGAAIPKEPLDVNEVIDDYLKSPEYGKLRQFHPGVTVRAELDPDLCSVNGSASHIRKAVMNLVSNAAEAIECRGSVVVSTEGRFVDGPVGGYERVNKGRYAVLSVADDGPGITAEDLQRIFEPFFTKKVLGRSGTGLGLTVVWNVIQDHEGYIDVATGSGGSRFDLYFPATAEPVRRRAPVAAIEDLYGSGQKILVVDDVQSQREITCEMLELLHYRAEAVSGGEEALRYLAKGRVDLLLLDMIMDPGMDGRETYARAVELHPGQKAIVISGFAETEQVRQTLRLGAGRYLRKPFLMEELGEAVKRELEGC
jgi:PAS domain S-box-containing protein